MSIKDLETYFAHVDFFLKKKESLPHGPTIKTLSFECSTSQIVYKTNKTFYNLNTRGYYRGPGNIYDIKSVIHHIDDWVLEVKFIIRNSDTYERTGEMIVKWYLDNELLPCPMRQDYQPRLDCLERFQVFQTKGHRDFTIEHIEKFFRACSTAALASTYINNPEALKYRKPIHKGLLTRLVQWVGKMWTMSDHLHDTFTLSTDPKIIADQRLDDPDPDSDPFALGNFVIILYYRHPKKDGKTFEEFRW